MFGRWATQAARRAAAALGSAAAGGTSSCSAGSWEAGTQLRSMAVGSKSGSSGASSGGGMSQTLKWQWLKSQGADVNPCNSALHPSVTAGMPPSGDAVPVQQAYNPSSTCFGCGAP